MKVRAGVVLGGPCVQSPHIQFFSSIITELLLCAWLSARLWGLRADAPQSPQQPLKNVFTV